MDFHPSTEILRRVLLHRAEREEARLARESEDHAFLLRALKEECANAPASAGGVIRALDRLEEFKMQRRGLEFEG